MNMGDYSTPLLTFVSTVLVSFLSAIVPVVNAELFVVFLGTVAPPTLYPALLVVATLSHMLGKSVMYVAGRSVDKLPEGKFKRRIEAASSKLSTRPNVGVTVVFLSALIGMPPFYLISVLSGAIRFSFVLFFLSGFGGRLVRFAALILLPEAARLLVR